MLHLFIQFFKKILENIFKITFFIFLTIFTLELITRLIIFIPTNINVFKYGIKKTVSFDVVDLSKFQISIYDFDKKEDINKKKESNNPIWIFGGSTTNGYNCEYKQSSSWPDEIYKIDKNFDYKNFAFDGANTDQQLTLLLREISLNKPKTILWANKFNVSNILKESNYKNKKILKHEFQNSTNINFFTTAKEIDMTLKSYLLFYSLLDKIIHRITKRFDIKINKIQPSKKDLFFAVKNFEINTINAIEASIKNGVKEFFIISLFYNHNQFDKLENYKFSLYNKTISNIKNTYSPFVMIIDLDLAFKNIEKEELLCDAVHQTLKGNKLQANFIFKELTKKSKIINE